MRNVFFFLIFAAQSLAAQDEFEANVVQLQQGGIEINAGNSKGGNNPNLIVQYSLPTSGTPVNGTTVTDSSGNGNNGSVAIDSGTAAWSSIPSYSSSGSLDVPNNDEMNITVGLSSGIPAGTAAWTVNCWVNTASGNNHAFQIEDGSGNYFGIILNVSGGDYIQWITQSDNDTIGSGSEFSANTTFMLTVVNNGSGTVTAYINGSSVGTASPSIAVGTITSFTYGQNTGQSSYGQYCGFFQFFNMALTGAQISSLFSSGPD